MRYPQCMRFHLIAGGIVAAVVVAIVAGVLLVGSGQNSLAEAAGRLDGQNVRMKMSIGYTMDGEDGSMAGEAISNSDGTRMKMDVEFADGPARRSPMQMLLIRDDTWYTSDGLEELRGQVGARVDSRPRRTRCRWPSSPSSSPTPTRFRARATTQIGGASVEHYAGKVNARELAEETGGETAKRFEKVLGDNDFFAPDRGLDRRGGPPGADDDERRRRRRVDAR